MTNIYENVDGIHSPKKMPPHGCPGCIRGLPLPPPVKGTRNPISEEIFVISDS